jgi:flagellar hook protein FlgE
MGLSSLFTGISGLTSFSTSISVIGNNLANVNTNGFKAGRVGFSDILSQSLTGSTGEYQVGRGVELSTVDLQFGQGSFETSASPTDLAIDGDGFFIVKDPNGTYYTRSGMYIFDTNGDLVNPNGYALQGWRLDANGQISGTLGNINIGAISSAPNTTSNAYYKLNLDSRDTIPTLNWDDQDPHRSSNYSSSMTLYDSLGREHMVTAFFRKTGNNSSNQWQYFTIVNANEVAEVHYSSEQRLTQSESYIQTTTALANIAHETITSGDSITINGTYDAAPPGGAVAITPRSYAIGSSDTVATLLGEIVAAFAADGFTVTATLTTDGRIQVQAAGADTCSLTLTESPGSIDFGTFGAAANTITSDRWMTESALTTIPMSTTTEWAQLGASVQTDGQIALSGTRTRDGTAVSATLDLDTQDLDTSGRYDVGDLLNLIETTFSQTAGDVTAEVTQAGRIKITDNTAINNQGASQLSVIITPDANAGTLNFGAFSVDDYHQTGSGNLTFTTNGALDTETQTAVSFNWLGGATRGSTTFDFGDSITTEGGTGLDGSTQFASNSATLFQSQDGYSSGHLMNLSVNTDGEVTGLFSNGTSMSIYKIALSNFASPWQLNQVGKNLFAESQGSGQPIIGVPGSSGLGKTASNSLEMSNVDIATEFVNLIKTQQAFQANSRIITTTDQMLQDIINLKR